MGKSKAVCAGLAAKEMNRELNIEIFKLRVCPETSNVFTGKFLWRILDFVVNAVDNVKARKFIDDYCVAFHKPLFESGTLGTKCNSQVAYLGFLN